eukprot:scaffold20371_cov102-Isochrysis_galbana.AAC.10
MCAVNDRCVRHNASCIVMYSTCTGAAGAGGHGCHSSSVVSVIKAINPSYLYLSTCKLQPQRASDR